MVNVSLTENQCLLLTELVAAAAFEARRNGELDTMRYTSILIALFENG